MGGLRLSEAGNGVQKGEEDRDGDKEPGTRGDEEEIEARNEGRKEGKDV